jgi:hypothetical protein
MFPLLFLFFLDYFLLYFRLGYVQKIRRCDSRGLFRAFFGAFVLGVIPRI